MSESIGEFRILKQTYGDGSELFLIQFRRKLNNGTPWVLITSRQDIKAARDALSQARNKAVVKEEVVE